MVQYPLTNGNKEDERRRLKYPADYQYANAKPKSTVQPSTPFGREVALQAGDSPTEKYANWFTSPDNPRFALNIANRLWAEIFGLGQIEPVNDMKEDSQAFNPVLMNELVKLLVDLKFDLRKFQTVLYKTELFQRASVREEYRKGDPFYFPGPQLRRMSAEQMWDSLMTLAVPEIDKRMNPALLRTDANIEHEAKWTLDADPEEIVTKVKMLSDPKEEKAYRKKLGSMMMGSDTRMMAQEMAKEFKGYNRQFYRAAELTSPAPGGSFLYQFGQSDRLIPENESDEAHPSPRCSP